MGDSKQFHEELQTKCHLSVVWKPCDKGSKRTVLAGIIHQYAILCEPLL